MKKLTFKEKLGFIFLNPPVVLLIILIFLIISPYLFPAVFNENNPKEIKIMENTLQNRSDKIKFLEEYSLFLEKNGYMDTNWRVEEPFAIDEFLKEE